MLKLQGFRLAAIVLACSGTATALEGDVALYAGTSSGAWEDGANEVTYLGAGVTGRSLPRAPAGAPAEGFRISAGAAVEKEEVGSENPDGRDPTCENCFTSYLIWTDIVFGGFVRPGYQWKALGLEVGTWLRTGHEEPGAAAPRLRVLPSAELELILGSSSSFVMGVFSPPTTTALRRPSFGMVGLRDVPISPGFHFDLMVGAAPFGPELTGTVGPRFDLVTRIGLGAGLWLRPGAALFLSRGGQGHAAVAPSFNAAGEGSLGVAYTPPQ